MHFEQAIGSRESRRPCRIESRQRVAILGNGYFQAQTARATLNAGTLHVHEKDARIAGSLIVNDAEPPEYASVAWNFAPRGKVLVIHLLMVRPGMAGKHRLGAGGTCEAGKGKRLPRPFQPRKPNPATRAPESIK